MSNPQLYSKKKKILGRAWVSSFLGLAAVVFAYYVGGSSIIFADLLRRGVEFLSLLFSWIIFLFINKKTLPDHVNKKLESVSGYFVALIMLISFAFISYNAYQEFLEPTKAGWLLPGMIVASVALINNGYFWRKYRKITKEDPTQIIESQRRLYRAKTLGDLVVLITLLSTHFFVSLHWHQYIDPAGSAIIALFVLFSAVRILKKGTNNNPENGSGNKQQKQNK